MLTHKVIRIFMRYELEFQWSATAESGKVVGNICMYKIHILVFVFIINSAFSLSIIRIFHIRKLLNSHIFCLP